MKFLILGFVVSLIVTLLVVRSANRHVARSADRRSGPQKVHARPVPRIGGLALFLGVLAAVVWAQWSHYDDRVLMWSLLLASVPAFLAGLGEDLTGNVSVRRRLVLTGVSAVLGVALLDAVLARTDIPGLDMALTWFPAAIALTLVAVTGMSNSINIIDGFNGLASMCVLFMLLALAYVAFQVGDNFVFQMALIFIGAVVGFFVWNYPAGMIFLGDGGAYLLGFSVAELSIMLVRRNAEVSPLFPLLLCMYPIFETLFSMYRRAFIRGVATVAADGIHLHTLIYRRVVRAALELEDERRQNTRNSMTSPFLWALCLMSVIPAVLWWESPGVMACFIGLFGVSYVLLYWRIITFRTPKWLLLFKR